MKIINVFFKLNSKDEGYKTLWMKHDGHSLSDIDPFISKISKDLFGFSLGFKSIKIDQPNTFLVSTVSSWSFSDQFGRVGLSLWHGGIVEVTQERESIVKFLKYVISILKVHQIGYIQIGELLASVARTKSLDNDKNLFDRIEDFRSEESKKILFGQQEIDSIFSTINSLKRQSQNLRIFSEFPFHENLALCCLLGLQVLSPKILRVGAGYLENFHDCHSITTNSKVDGFQDVNITPFFSQGVQMKNLDQPSPQSNGKPQRLSGFLSRHIVWPVLWGVILTGLIFLIDNIVGRRYQQINQDLYQQEIQRDYFSVLPQLLTLDKTEKTKFASSRTSMLLANLNDSDKKTILDFLYDSKLIGYPSDKTCEKPVIELAKVSLSEMDLNNVNWSCINLARVNLSDAKLENANLSGANLEEVILENANLSNANLKDANLKNANLKGATVTNVNLEEAKLCETIMPDGSKNQQNCAG